VRRRLGFLAVGMMTIIGGSLVSAPQAVAKPSAPGTLYPAAVRHNFLKSCDSTSGGRDALCGCALAHIEKALSFKAFEANEKGLVEGTQKLSPAILKAEKQYVPKKASTT
jgi:hypothetical protein